MKIQVAEGFRKRHFIPKFQVLAVVGTTKMLTDFFSHFNDLYAPSKRKELFFQGYEILGRHFAEENCRFCLRFKPNF